MVQELKTPRNYYEGCGAVPTGNAYNVILFNRKTEKALMGLGTSRHFHHRYVLIRCFETGGVIGLDGLQRELKPGECILLFPYQMHLYLQLEKPELNWAFLTFEHPEPERLKRLKNRVFPVGDRDNLVFEWILKKWLSNEGAGSAFWIESAVQMLLEMMLEQARETEQNELVVEKTEQLIHRIQGEVFGLSGVYRIKDLSDRLHLSESRLRARFLSETGISLGHFLRRVRLQKAAAMLVKNTDRLGAIAEVVGYDSVYSFSRAFKSTFGVAPMQYRNGKGRGRLVSDNLHLNQWRSIG